MKAIVRNSGKTVDIEVCYAKDDSIFYRDHDNKTDYNPGELEFYLFDEPEEEVTIEGVAEKCSDGITRVYIGYVNSFILPCDCNIEGEVTITIKTKKK